MIVEVSEITLESYDISLVFTCPNTLLHTRKAHKLKINWTSDHWQTLKKAVP